LKAVTNIADHRVSWIKARPLNCDAKLKEDQPCPDCKQVHLRAGYCQAIDLINAKRYPHLHQSHKPVMIETESHGDETETDFETGESQPWIAEGISRATYYRRRAEGK
jgi:hypothetical protein